jgi:hypothetical protein
MAASPEIDPALVRAAQRGDRMAQGELMDALIPFLGRLCGPIALQDGPDAVQEALIAIFRNLSQLREPAAIFGWHGRSPSGRPSGSRGRPPAPSRRNSATYRRPATRSSPPTSPMCSAGSARNTGPS